MLNWCYLGIVLEKLNVCFYCLVNIVIMLNDCLIRGVLMRIYVSLLRYCLIIFD